MKKIIIISLIAISNFSIPLHAQWYGRIIKGTRTQLGQLHQKVVRPAGVTRQQLDRAVFQAGKKTSPSVPVIKASKALIPLREHHCVRRFCGVDGTAFAIEETYQGKRYVWGVTATHYRYREPAIAKNRFKHEPFAFSAQGHPGANDVSIFPIPESLADTFEALQLAEKAPVEGESLFSLSFFDHDLQYTPDRKVLMTSPLRFITSVKADIEINREGECGSPLLNNQGEVVGMVVGASYRRQIGFAVPVEQIRQILKAYHNREAATKPLRVNGNEIFQLDVTEAISRVSVRYRDGVVIDRNTYHQEQLLDYDHLETFMDLSRAEEIQLTINTNPFFSGAEGYRAPTRLVTYNLQTQNVSVSILP